MSELIERLEQWHRAHRAELLDELAPGAEESELAKLQQRVGEPLPLALIALLKWHNGRKPHTYSGLVHNQMLMSVGDIIETMDCMDELVDAGEFDEPLWWHKKWVPFLDNGGGDHLCVDLEGCFGGESGQLVEFWHEESDRMVAYPNIDVWLAVFVEALERNMFKDDDGDMELVDDEGLEALLASKAPGYPKEADAGG